MLNVLSQEVISRRVLVDEGLRQVVELEQAALWRFLWWSGTISVHVIVDQNREDHSVRNCCYYYCCCCCRVDRNCNLQALWYEVALHRVIVGLFIFWPQAGVGCIPGL
jgi:hypothetical protein